MHQIAIPLGELLDCTSEREKNHKLLTIAAAQGLPVIDIEKRKPAPGTRWIVFLDMETSNYIIEWEQADGTDSTRS